MSDLRITEIKAFIPSKNFDLSKQFYKDLGFTMASEGGGVAYFHFDQVSFLLQDFSAEAFAENFMMHILVQDVDAWWNLVHESGVIEKYNVEHFQVKNPNRNILSCRCARPMTPNTVGIHIKLWKINLSAVWRHL